MARKGKITLYLSETTHASEISVRTVGALGTVALNTVTLDIPVNYAISGADAGAVWNQVLTLVLPHLV